jgi:hypothetical protein
MAEPLEIEEDVKNIQMFDSENSPREVRLTKQ